MSFMDLFWIIMLLSAFQPVISQRMLEYARQRKIAEIERKHGSRVIALVHRQETMRLFGFPLVKYIDIQDSEEVLRAIHMTDRQVPIDLILHTPGGLVLAAVQIARAIKAHPGKVTVYVPHYAMSGGTLIALAADEIVMSEHAVLGPVDPQLGDMPAASLVKVTEEKPVKDVEDRTLVLADVGRKAINQVRDVVEELLAGKLPEERVGEAATRLATGTWTHDYPITPDHARTLGLPVSTEINADVLELMTLYPQPVRTLPSVEYLPGWRKGASSHPVHRPAE